MNHWPKSGLNEARLLPVIASREAVPNGDVPALRKGLAVLELLASGEALTMAEIQQRAKLAKTMTFRILRVLREQGYIQHDAGTHRYRLSLKLLELGRAQAARLDIVQVSQPLLEALRAEFRETINVCLRDGSDVVYVAMVESQHGLRTTSLIGSRDPLYSTAVGKAILAFLPAKERATALAECTPVQFTVNTVTSPEALAAELVRTRQRGFAVDNEENELGARCVGVPILGVRGYPIAAMSLSGPRSRIGDERVVPIAAGLARVSQEISRRLGYVVEANALVIAGAELSPVP